MESGTPLKPIAGSEKKKTMDNGNGRLHINIGDVVHFLEVAAILISIGINYQRFQQIAADVSSHTQALTRIERYLSSKDSDYWHKTHRNGD